MAKPTGFDTGAATDERRQVTILFADLSGFTALSQSLDREEVHELVSRYTALVDQVVVGYSGAVDKNIGDAVMALFGAPRAHDDDRLRAARAAIDIREALAR
ncbi:MAG: adenylate/guanylate cyclase domain-containing protein [Acetobacteraceae bacterium]|nr:adenylate/guanylate cyclase domain-containing protein [Acetobacteraceae bacterium]